MGSDKVSDVFLIIITMISKLICYTFGLLYLLLSTMNELFVFTLGLKYVISRTFRRFPCSTNRFQPITFWSNRSTDCLYLKSPCSETGQLVLDNTSTIGDSTCRCDYTRHYAFVSPPRNLCFCTPSLEDCSCYIKQCPENTTLSPGK